MKEIASNFLPDTCETETTMDCNACVIKKVGLAQAFVPSQPYQTPSSAEQSLICGTAFSDLSMPYVQGSHIKRNARVLDQNIFKDMQKVNSCLSELAI